MGPCTRAGTLASMWRQTLCQLSRYRSASAWEAGVGVESPATWGMYFCVLGPSVVCVEK